MTPGDVMGRVLLLSGPEEYLRERTVAQARAVVLAADPEAEVTDATGDQVSAATLSELSAPSLFSSTRFAVVRALEDTPDAAFDDVLAFATNPPEDVALVLVHGGGQKGTGLLNRLRKLPLVTEQKAEALKPSELPRFVAAEAKLYGGRIAEDAAEILVSAIGADLRALAGAARQLAEDFPEQPLTAEVVGRYFGGRAEVKAFNIADHALFGRAAKALEELRWALDSGLSGPAITGSFANSVRSLAKVKAGDVAGVPPWKLRILRDQARGWDERGLARAVTAVATADADVKGAASDAAYALERMVLSITQARTGR